MISRLAIILCVVLGSAVHLSALAAHESKAPDHETRIMLISRPSAQVPVKQDSDNRGFQVGIPHHVVTYATITSFLALILFVIFVFTDQVSVQRLVFLRERAALFKVLFRFIISPNAP